jgi:anti-sigma-K factor RskA
MDHQTIQELLPFYVNGTLGEEDRKAVEDALASSADLRRELRFWELSAGACAAASERTREGHLSARQIVERARGTITSADLPALDHHLLICRECADLVERVRGSFEAEPVNEPRLPWKGRTRWSWRLAAAASVAAVAVIMVVVFTRQDPAPPDHANGPGTHTLPAPGDGIASLTLTYQPRLRSANAHAPTLLTLHGTDTVVRLSIAVPHNAVEGIRYSVEAGSRSGGRTRIAGNLPRWRSGTLYDTLAVDVAPELLLQSGTKVQLTVRELLSPDMSGLTPEEYVFDLAIDRVP